MVYSPNGLYIQNIRMLLVEIGPGGILLAWMSIVRNAPPRRVRLLPSGLPCQYCTGSHSIPMRGPISAGCDQHGAAKAVAADVDEYVMRPEFDTREQVTSGRCSRSERIWLGLRVLTSGRHECRGSPRVEMP